MLFLILFPLNNDQRFLTEDMFDGTFVSFNIRNGDPSLTNISWEELSSRDVSDEKIIQQ